MQRLKIKANGSLYLKALYIILAFFTMVILSYVFTSKIEEGNLVQNANSVLDFAEERATSDLRDVNLTLSRISVNMSEMILQGDTEDMLREYIRSTGEYARLFGETGIAIKGVYGYFETLPGGPILLEGNYQMPSDGTPIEEQPWYLTAIQSPMDIVETIPYINNNDETILTYAKCILDEDGKRLGVLCIDMDITTIGDEIVATARNRGGHGMLLNQDLLIICHPNKEFVGRFGYEKDIPFAKFTPIMKRGKDVSQAEMVSYRGEPSVAFYRKISNGWYLGMVTPSDQYYESTREMAITLSVTGSILAIILIVILTRIDLARIRSDDENKKKRMFLANMSHEIRTPINAIVGMTAIGRTAVNAERKDYCFAKIDDASRHLLGVVNDILDMSKIEANKMEFSPTNFNFEKMLQQVVNVVNFRVDEKRQKLTVRIDKKIPPILFADDQKFAQVITNLLGNAIKFTPEEGRIIVNADCLGEEDGLYTIQVEVTDSGIGISEEQQKKLFQSFQQAESSTTRQYGGTGLGLAISKNIVERMGGSIHIKSALGEGTTFTFTVKLKEGEGADLYSRYRGINWENIGILVVDDDPDILVYFSEIVTSLGAKCDVVPDASQALDRLEEKGPYNIYFIDLRMPYMDGISLTKEIRAREKDLENAIVIMISSAELSGVEEEAREAGVNHFLLKPLFPSTIADIISQSIGLVADRAQDLSAEIEGIFNGRRMLLVEDLDINQEIALALLEPTQIETDCADNGVQAVQMFSAEPERYDIILMDVQMPEMDGYEATRQIRALDHEWAKEVPIVAMTANVFREDIANCLEAGMNGHLGKPIDMDELIRAMVKYLK